MPASGCLHRHLPAPAGAGAGHHRRLQAAGGGCGRCRLRGAGRGDEGRWWPRRASDPALAKCVHQLRHRPRRSFSPISTAPKRRSWGWMCRSVFDAMQIYLGSLYINDFNKFGRTYQVIAQADKEFRSKPEDILRLQTRNFEGQDGAVGRDGAGYRHHRPGKRHALQRLPLGRSQWRARARAIPAGQAQAGDRQDPARDPAQGHAASNGPS